MAWRRSSRAVASCIASATASGARASVRPFDASVKGYYVVCRGSDWTQRPIATFREWLVAQARADAVGAV